MNKGFARSKYNSPAGREAHTPKEVTLEDLKAEAEKQMAQVAGELDITPVLDEYGLQMATFTLPVSKIEVAMREPRAGDIRHMELEGRRLEKQYGVDLEGTLTGTYPLLTRLICKWGSNHAERNPNNGLTLKTCITYDDLDVLATTDLTALSAACNFFRGKGNPESEQG